MSTRHSGSLALENAPLPPAAAEEYPRPTAPEEEGVWGRGGARRRVGEGGGDREQHLSSCCGMAVWEEEEGGGERVEEGQDVGTATFDSAEVAAVHALRKSGP